MKNAHKANSAPVNELSTRLSIGTKLSITFLALAIIPMSVVAFYNLSISRNEFTKHAENELIGLSHNVANSIEQLLVENLRNSAMLAGDPLTREFISASVKDRQKLFPKVQKMLKNFTKTHPDYLPPGLLDANGIVIATEIDKLMGKDRSFRDYFQTSIKGTPYISDILVGRATGKPGVFLTNPVFSEEGKPIGIVLIWLKADTIWKIIDQVRVGHDGIAYLIDQDGVIIAHPNRDLLYHSLGQLKSDSISTISSTFRFGTDQNTKKPLIPKNLGLDELAARVDLSSEPATFSYSSPQDRINHIVGFSAVKSQPWTVVVDLPETQFLASFKQLQTIALISIGSVALFTILISILLAKTITRPIRTLTDISIDVMHSKPFNFSKIETVIKGRDEIAHLGRVFRKMIVSLRESEEKYRNLVDSSPDLRYRADMEGNISFISPSVELLSGYTAKEAIGMKLKDLYVYPEERELFLSKLQKNGYVNEFEAQLLKKDGTIWWASTNAHFSKDQFNNIVGIEGVTRDITERKQMEKELQQSLDFREQILSKSPVGISIYNAETGQCVAASNSMAEIIGATKQQVLSQNFYDIEFWKKSGLLNTAMGSLKENTIKKIEVSVESTLGKKISASCHFAPFLSGEQNYLLFTLTDITDLKLTEKELVQSEERFQVLAKNLPQVLWMTDKDLNTMLFVSDAYETIYGKSCESLYKNPGDFINSILPEDRGYVEEYLNQKFGKDTFESEYRILRTDGEVRWIRDRGWPIKNVSGEVYRVAGIAEDITQQILLEQEKEKLEVQVFQAHKMEAIGTLAGGIAHDFNNMLSIITGNISYALSSLKKNDDLFNVLSEAQDGVKQAQSLTHQLLTFSKGGEPVKKIANINQLIKDSAQFVLSGTNVRCEFDLSKKLYNAEVDSGQINQVISNLLINANQSMPEGGTIYLKTENIRFKGEKDIPLPDGNYIKLMVEDQGIGISKNHLTKIFDPFFTTKQKGNGLGLSTVYSIIQKHNGYITAYSEIEKGTTFYIYLPASQKILMKDEEKQEVLHHGKGKILIMDDQESILVMGERMLGRMGYETSSAKDGTQAIEMYKEALSSENPFDLVILDLTVPGGMGGLKTITELLKINSKVKAAVSSGYSNDPVMANYEDYGFSAIIPKPYTLSQLSEALNQVFGKNE